MTLDCKSPAFELDDVFKLLVSLRLCSHYTLAGKEKITALMCRFCIDYGLYRPAPIDLDYYIPKSNSSRYMCFALDNLLLGCISKGLPNTYQEELHYYQVLAKFYITTSIVTTGKTLRTTLKTECWSEELWQSLGERVEYPEYWFYIGFIAKTFKEPLPEESVILYETLTKRKKLRKSKANTLDQSVTTWEGDSDATNKD